MIHLKLVTITLTSLLLLACGSDSGDDGNTGGNTITECQPIINGAIAGGVNVDTTDFWGINNWIPTAHFAVIQGGDKLLSFNSDSLNTSTNSDIMDISFLFSSRCVLQGVSLMYYNTGDVAGLDNTDNRYIYQIDCGAGACTGINIDFLDGITFNNVSLTAFTGGTERNDAVNMAFLNGSLTW